MDATTISTAPTNLERAAAAIRTNRRYTDETAFRTESRSLHMRLFAAVPITLVLGGIVAWIGLAAALQIATLGGLTLIGYRFWRGEPISLKNVALFIISVVAVYVAAGVLTSRLWASILLAAATFVFFERRGKKPLEFIREYLYADSVFTNDQRGQLASDPLHPSRLMLLLFLAVVVFVPWLHSTSFAILLLCLLCPAFVLLHIAREGTPISTLRVAIRSAAFFLTEYLTYPDVDSAARSWSAPERCDARRNTFTYLWVSLAATLIVALSYCIPWEFFAAHFQPGFQWTVPPTGTLHHSWLSAPIALALSASGEYRWALGIGAVLSFLLPYVMLFTLYLPAIQKCVQTMEAVEKSKQCDTRTEYERRVDRTLDSEVVEG